MRSLASIQKIIEVKTIENADAIELVIIKGWQLIFYIAIWHELREIDNWRYSEDVQGQRNSFRGRVKANGR